MMAWILNDYIKYWSDEVTYQIKYDKEYQYLLNWINLLNQLSQVPFENSRLTGNIKYFLLFDLNDDDLLARGEI